MDRNEEVTGFILKTLDDEIKWNRELLDAIIGKCEECREDVDGCSNEECPLWNVRVTPSSPMFRKEG
jgi:hypothetical protein